MGDLHIIKNLSVKYAVDDTSYFLRKKKAYLLLYWFFGRHTENGTGLEATSTTTKTGCVSPGYSDCLTMLF